MQPHALIVDDNPLNSRLLAILLRRQGWEASACDDAEQGWQRLQVQPLALHLLLLDLRLPGQDGQALCRRVRATPALAGLRVVAYTAHGMPDDLQRLREIGFDDTLIKPIALDDMRTLCRRAEDSLALRLRSC